jgi:hypothetical protein
MLNSTAGGSAFPRFFQQLMVAALHITHYTVITYDLLNGNEFFIFPEGVLAKKGARAGFSPCGDALF